MIASAIRSIRSPSGPTDHDGSLSTCRSSPRAMSGTASAAEQAIALQALHFYERCSGSAKRRMAGGIDVGASPNSRFVRRVNSCPSDDVVILDEAPTGRPWSAAACQKHLS